MSAVKASTLIQVPMPAPKTPPKGGLVSLPHGTCLYFRCSSTSENHSIIQCLHWMMKLPLAASTLIQVPMPAPKTPPKGGVWCGHGDLNPNASRHRNLNPACLPISSCPHWGKKKPAANAAGFTWSGQRGSNSLPPPWQGGALPDELCPRQHGVFYHIFLTCQEFISSSGKISSPSVSSSSTPASALSSASSSVSVCVRRS